MRVEDGIIHYLSNEDSSDPKTFHLMIRSLVLKVPLADLERGEIEIFEKSGKAEFRGSFKEYLEKYGKESYKDLANNLRAMGEGHSVDLQDIQLPVVYLSKRKIIIDHPIHVAAKELMDPAVFLALKADPNFVSFQGQTPLSILCLKRNTNPEAIKTLIEMGARPKFAIPGKKTPYQIAQSVHRSNKQLLELLAR